MSAWYMLMDPRFGLYKSGSRMARERPSPRPAGGWSWRQLRDFLAACWLQARTEAQLRRLGPSQLADIGIEPARIAEAVRERVAQARPRASRDGHVTITMDVSRLPGAR